MQKPRFSIWKVSFLFSLILIQPFSIFSAEMSVRKEIGRMKSKKFETKINALKKLTPVLKENKDVLQAFIRALDNEDERIRAEASNVLGNARVKKAVLPLISALKKEKSDFAKINMLQALGIIGDRKAISVIKLFLKDKSEPVRYSAVYALKLLKSKNSHSLFKNALKDESPRIRILSAETLGTLKDGSGLKEVLEESKKQDPDVKIKVIKALVGIREKNSQVKKVLSKFAKDNDKAVREEAEKAMEKLGI